MSLIQFENVNYIYGVGTTFEKQALKNICFTVESGSFIGLIGHTGSGKSTLIQHVNGLIRPSSGKIYFHGCGFWPVESGIISGRGKKAGD